MKMIDPNEFSKEQTITYFQKRIPQSAWIQGNARIMDSIFEENLPDWHIKAYPYGRVPNTKDESLIVYQDTMKHAIENREAIEEQGKKALKPHPPVLPTNYSFLFYYIGSNGSMHLVPLPESIYPCVCWMVYGKTEDLATFKPELTCDSALRNHIRDLPIRVAAVKLAEYNPEVSFSYIWGNHMYVLSRFGSIPPTNLPNRQEYLAGLDDAGAIIREMQDDNSEG